MIEVMFGESEGGAIKAAKNYQKHDFNNGAIVCIPLMLDIGDINVPIESESRKKLIWNDVYHLWYG